MAAPRPPQEERPGAFPASDSTWLWCCVLLRRCRSLRGRADRHRLGLPECRVFFHPGLVRITLARIDGVEMMAGAHDGLGDQRLELLRSVLAHGFVELLALAEALVDLIESMPAGDHQMDVALAAVS